MPGTETPWRTSEVDDNRQIAFPIEAPDEIVVSYSALRLFEECPTRYWNSHGKGYPEKIRSGLVSAGSGLHRALAALGRATLEGTRLPPLAEVLNNNWPEAGFPSSDESDVWFQRCLAALEQIEFPAFFAGLMAVEVPFRVGIQHELTTAVFTGRIDRMDRAESGGIRIVEYKTFATPAASEQLAESTQTVIYWSVAQRITGKHTERMRYCYLEAATAVDVKLGDRDLADSAARLVEAAKRMAYAESLPPTPGLYCRDCPLLMSCKARGVLK